MTTPTPTRPDIIRALFHRATELRTMASNPPVTIQGEGVVMLTPKGAMQIVTLLERAAGELMEAGMEDRVFPLRKVG